MCKNTIGIKKGACPDFRSDNPLWECTQASPESIPGIPGSQGRSGLYCWENGWSLQLADLEVCGSCATQSWKRGISKLHSVLTAQSLGHPPWSWPWPSAPCSCGAHSART